MLSRCDECHRIFRHRLEAVVEEHVDEKVAEVTAIGDIERTFLRQSTRMRLCDACACR